MSTPTTSIASQQSEITLSTFTADEISAEVIITAPVLIENPSSTPIETVEPVTITVTANPAF